MMQAGRLLLQGEKKKFREQANCSEAAAGQNKKKELGSLSHAVITFNHCLILKHLSSSTSFLYFPF
jgi:hypothetical protein